MADQPPSPAPSSLKQRLTRFETDPHYQVWSVRLFRWIRTKSPGLQIMLFAMAGCVIAVAFVFLLYFERFVNRLFL